MTHIRLLQALVFAVVMSLAVAATAHPGYDDAPDPVSTTGAARASTTSRSRSRPVTRPTC